MGTLNEMSGKFSLCFLTYYSILNLFLLLGVRNLTSRRSLIPLLVGILVGFLIATIFISESRSLWFNFSGQSHQGELRDPH